MPKVDLDPSAYNSWQIIAFERVTGRSMFKVMDGCIDDDGTLVDMPADVLAAFAWVAEHPPEPSASIEQMRIDFATYAASVRYMDLMDSIGTDEEPDPTEPEATPQSS